MTLSRILKTANLPFSRIHVTAEGSVIGFPKETRFASITVHPEILGADESRADDYAEAARRARDRCFIGNTVRDSLDYKVGELRLTSASPGPQG